MVKAKKCEFVVATSIDSIYARQTENRRVEACATYSLVPSHTINAKGLGTRLCKLKHLCVLGSSVVLVN